MNSNNAAAADEVALYGIVEMAVRVLDLRWFGGLHDDKAIDRFASLLVMNAALAVHSGAPLSKKVPKDLLGIDAKTVRKHVGLLIQRGYLIESQSSADNRMKFLFLTPRAEKWLRDCSRRFIVDNGKLLTINPKEPDDEPQQTSNQRTISIDEEIAQYTKELEVDSDNVRALAFRGHLLYEKGNYSAALADSVDALRLHKGHFQAMWTCARLDGKNGNWGEAVDKYRVLVARRPMEMELLGELAGALEHDGRIEEALKCWESILPNSDPNETVRVKSKIKELSG